MNELEVTKDVRGWIEKYLKDEYPTGNLNGRFSDERMIEGVIAYLSRV